MLSRLSKRFSTSSSKPNNTTNNKETKPTADDNKIIQEHQQPTTTTTNTVEENQTEQTATNDDDDDQSTNIISQMFSALKAPSLPSIKISDKYNPGPITKFSSSSVISKSVRNFVNKPSESSASGVANTIITFLFDRDFSKSGNHWDDNGSSVSVVSANNETFQYVFDASASSTWDHRDIYAVAESSAKIHISLTEIFIENYGYYVSG
jgi:hypothetical protein